MKEVRWGGVGSGESYGHVGGAGGGAESDATIRVKGAENREVQSPSAVSRLSLSAGRR